MDQITPRQLDDWLKTPDSTPQLLDVREPWEYAICRIQGAELLPMRQIPTSMDQIARDRPVVVICHHGIRSQQVALYLEHQGFAEVMNLNGGVARWARDVDPTMPTY
jgi:rhodanese-related sulfurtransferase